MTMSRGTESHGDRQGRARWTPVGGGTQNRQGLGGSPQLHVPAMEPGTGKSDPPACEAGTGEYPRLISVLG